MLPLKDSQRANCNSYILPPSRSRPVLQLLFRLQDLVVILHLSGLFLSCIVDEYLRQRLQRGPTRVLALDSLAKRPP